MKILCEICSRQFREARGALLVVEVLADKGRGEEERREAAGVLAQVVVLITVIVVNIEIIVVIAVVIVIMECKYYVNNMMIAGDVTLDRRQLWDGGN